MKFSEIKEYVSQLTTEQRDTILTGLICNLFTEMVVDNKAELINFLEVDCTKSGNLMIKWENDGPDDQE